MNELKKMIYKKFNKIDDKLKNKIITEIETTANYQCDISTFTWKSNKLEEKCPDCGKKFISIKFKSLIKLKNYEIYGFKFYSDEEL